MTSEDMMKKWPEMHLPTGLVGLYDTKGGTVCMKKSFAAFKKLSKADLFYDQKVASIGPDSITLASGKVVKAQWIVVCCGHTQRELTQHSGESFPMETYHYKDI